MKRGVAVIEEVNRLSKEPFAWGVLDCCHFAAEVARSITGVNFAAGFAYSTEREAVQIINASGDGLMGFVTQLLGVEPRGVMQAADGDPVLCDLDTGPTIGVKLGDRVICKTVRGVGWLPILAEEALCSWDIEEAACLRQ